MGYASSRVAFFLMGAIVLAGCAGDDVVSPAVSVPAAPAMPPVTAGQITGKWGLGAYHLDKDRERTVREARAQCRKPYVIKAGADGGVVMNLADETEPRELVVKPTSEGRTFIGPADRPPGDVTDMEIIAVDETSFTIQWVDPEVAARYGTMVYVSCAAKGGKPKTG